jgi:spermidine synthase
VIASAGSTSLGGGRKCWLPKRGHLGLAVVVAAENPTLGFFDRGDYRVKSPCDRSIAHRVELMTTSSISRIAAPPRNAYLAVFVLFGASGASGLMLEVVWSRMLGWLLGATTWSVMTILVTFMGGLGLGGFFWGHRVGRSARPLRLFGLMEIAIGLYSLAVPILFDWLGRFFVAATWLTGESPGASLALRVIMAVLALAPPTLLMGGTLPVLTRFAAAERALPGRAAGLLYAVNTAGAVVGCFMTGCLLIFWLGVVETGIVAALIDLGVGTIALACDRRIAVPIGLDAGRPVANPDFDEFGEGGKWVAPDADRRVANPAAAGSAALLVATLSGFCGLAYELLWTRGLQAAVTDDTTYAFTLMLTAFLAGHALGAAIANRTGISSRSHHDWGRLGTTQIMAALTALLSLPLLVLIRDPINRASFNEAMTFWGARIPFHLAISLVVFAPSAAFLGASFVLAARLYVGRGRPVGASTGGLYGLNTVGAILGATATTALLIPALGTQGAILILAVLQAAQGATVILLRGDGKSGWPGRAYATLAWVLVIVLACGLNDLLRLTDIYARQEPGRLLALVEGTGATVTVHERNPDDRVISINGVNVAGTNPVLRRTQKLQAHLPVCLHDAPRSVLQIGFGSGGTCYSVSQHTEIESIVVVELNPDVLKVAATWFGEVNHGVLTDPRVRVRIVDAKSFVAVTEQTFDLILSDSTHPRFRGNAALYARDYIANCARRLRPGGIVSTWLPLYGMSTEDIRGILKSFQSVFPHVQVWYENFEPHENTIVIASREPIAIDPGLLAGRLAAAKVAEDLASVGIGSTNQLLDFFMLGDRAVAEFSRTGRLNTDDHPRLEFLAPLTMRRKQSWMENFAALRLAREPIAPYLVNADPEARATLARWHAGTTFKLSGQSFELEGLLDETLEAYTECFRRNPQDTIIRSRIDLLRRSYSRTRPVDSHAAGRSPPSELDRALRSEDPLKLVPGSGKQRPPPLSGSAGIGVSRIRSRPENPSRAKSTLKVSL